MRLFQRQLCRYCVNFHRAEEISKSKETNIVWISTQRDMYKYDIYHYHNRSHTHIHTKARISNSGIYMHTEEYKYFELK